MKNKYYCKEEGTEEYDTYYESNHISAAKKCALDILKHKSVEIKEIKIKVKNNDGESFIVEINFVRIKKNHC